jgi:hypothetical protein
MNSYMFGYFSHPISVIFIGCFDGFLPRLAKIFCRDGLPACNCARGFPSASCLREHASRYYKEMVSIIVCEKDFLASVAPKAQMINRAKKLWTERTGYGMFFINTICWKRLCSVLLQSI